MANEFVTRTGLIVSGSTFLPAVTTASKGYILSFDDTTKQVYYMSTSSVTVTVPGSDTQIIYNNGGAFGAASNFVFSGSNVGIGTTSPTAKLFVSGSTNTTALIKQGATSLSNNTYTLEVDNLSHSSNMSAAGAFRVSTNGNTGAFVVNGIGNVSIGTNIPQNNLHISGSANGTDAGNIRIDSTDQYGGLVINENTTFRTFLGYGNAGNIFSNAQSDSTALRAANYLHLGASSAATITINGSNDYVGIGTTSPAQQLHLTGNILLENNQIIRWKNASGAERNIFSLDTNNQLQVGGSIDAIRFLTNDSSERMRITSAGNVGIGITSPEAKLDVSGSIKILYPTGKLYAAATPSFYGEITPFNSSGHMIFNVNYPEGNIIFQSGSVEVARFKDAKLGIGTSSPLTLLDLRASSNTSITPLASVPDTSTTLLIGNTGTNGVLALGHDNAGHPWLQGRSVLANQAAEDILINPLGGNVGIGTTSPSEILDVQKAGTVAVRVYNTSSTADAYFNAKNSTGDAFFGINATGQYLYTSNNIPTLFYNSGSERMRITNAGNVGIGTTSPAAKLDVVGSAGIRVNEDGIGTKVISIRSDFAGVDPAINVSTNNALLLQTNNTERMRIAAGGNVGIGTTSPNAKLDVNGNVIVTGSLTVSGSSTFTNIGPAVFTGSITQNASTASFGGVVGIGTATPAAKLDVSGTGRFSGDVTVGLGNALENLVIINGQTYSGVRFQRSSTTKWAIFNNNAGTDFIDFYNYSTNSSAFYISPTNAATFAAGVTAASFTGSFSGSVSAPGSTTQIVYNSGGALAADSGLVYSGSRVGIGTTTPANNLHIYGTGDQIIKIENSGTYLMYLGLVSNEGYIGSTNATPLTFYTNNVNRMYITTGGNVGIGTTSPFNKLTVGSVPASGYGLITISSDWASGTAISTGIKIGAANDTGGAGVDIRSHSNYAASAGTEMSFWTNSTGNVLSERMRIASEGNVGIGTTSPQYKLEVVNPSNNANIAVTAASGYQTALELKGTDRWYRLISQPTAGNGGRFDIYDQTGGAFRLSINTDGNVGIGTSNPSYKLDVAGVGRLLSVGIIQASSNSDTPNIAFTNNGTSFTWGTIGGLLQGDGDGALFFNTKIGGSVTEKMRITSAGNVGIGTTSPGAKLDVYGVASSDTVPGLRVLGNDWGSISNAMVRFDGGPASDGNILLLKSQNNNRSDSEIFEIQNSGSNTVFVVKGTGNVGIGTSNPSYNLHVSSSGYYGGNLTVEGTITAQKLNVQQITSSVVYSSGSNIFGNSLANTQTFTGSIQATGSSHYFLGNVGVGTTDPSTSLGGAVGLVVDGKATNDVQIRLQSDTTGRTSGDGGLLSISSTLMYLWNYENNALIYGTNNTERMRITGAGNVGIGTDSPTAKLNTYGTGWTSNASGSGLLRISATDDFPTLTFAHTQTPKWSLYVGGGGSWVGNGSIGFVTHDGTEDASRVKMMITSGSGNVGIGTTSPAQKLDVAGNILATEGGIASYRTSSEAQVVVNLSGNQMYMFNNSSAYGLYSTDYGSLFIRNKSTGLLNIYDKIYTTSGGNVGINTSTPYTGTNVTSLDINATAYPVLALSIGSSYIGGMTGFSNHVAVSAKSGNYITLEPNDTEAVRITSAGNVGIGTSSPISGQGTPLTLASSTGYVGLTLSGSGAYSHLWQLYASGDGGSNKFFGIYDSTNATYRLVTTSGGNVGIGITGPAYKLSINGSAGIEANEEYFYFHSTYSVGSNARAKIRAVGAGGGSGYGGDFRISTRATNNTWNEDAVTVNYAGNVGIGTTSPGSKLNVTDGFIRVNGADTDQYFFEGVRTGVSTTLRIYDNSSIPFYDAHSSMVFRANQNGGSGGYIGLFGGNVGIGTSTPTGRLTVAPYNTVNSSSIEFTNADNAVISSYYSQTFAVDNTNTQSGRQFVFAKGGKGYGTQTKTMMVIDADSGNVGIGTTSPSTALTIARAAATAPVLTLLTTDSTSNGYISWKNSSGTQNAAIGTNYGVSDTGAIEFISGSVTNMILRSSGNLGIGTTGPTEKLAVNGNIEITNPYGKIGFDVGDTYGDYPHYGLGKTNGAYPVNLAGYFGLTFGTAGSERVIIDGSGNVGIGTTSPESRLHIAQSNAGGKVTLYIDNNASSTLNNEATIKFSVDSGASATVGGAEISTINVNAGNGNSDLTFKTFNASSGLTEKVRITSGGNVGIGTTNPVYPLHVDSSVQQFRISGNTNHLNMYSWGGGVNVWSSENLYFGRDAATANKIFFQNGSASTTTMYVNTATEVVGIGTDSPVQTLDVFKNTNSVNAISVRNPSTGANAHAGLYIGNDTGNNSGGIVVFGSSSTYSSPYNPNGTYLYSNKSGGVAIVAESSAPVYIATNNNIRLYITSGGNVGIGTTTPNQKLSVEGGSIYLNANNAAANYYLYINKKSGQDGGILFNRDNTNDWQLTNGAGNGDLIFYSYGISNDAVTFKRATGNVGIGTTSPSYRLQVSGSIAIENQGTTTIESTTFSGTLTSNTNIAFVPTGSFKAAFFDYYVASGSVNMRAGTVMAVHNNSTSRYTDTSTADIGTTAPVDFSTSIVAGSLVLTANISSGTWEVKTAYRAL